MSVCLWCEREFKVRKGSQGKYCSHQCFCAYEHANKSYNCMGVSRINSKGNWVAKNKDKVFERKYGKKENLFEGFDLKIDEAMDKSNWSNAREKSLVKVTELSPRGKMILVKAFENNLKYLKTQKGMM
jgi:hypothetical protein